MTVPRLFLSYCWSTPDHEQWVVALANELTQSGIDVVFDKWELREGHDAIAFMEKMVTDESITKVVMVCDRVYADKADGRQGGVGTETQIISREVYEKTAQNKFVAVIAERAEDDSPFLPTYYKSRIYIDLSNSANYTDNFEKLVRWAFDKPLYVKPTLGRPPSFIAEAHSPLLGTSALAKRAIEGVKADKAYARGAFDEYLSNFSQNLEQFRIAESGAELDDQIVAKVDAFEPWRNEFIQVLTSFAQYAQPGSTGAQIHRFLESVLVYFERPESQSSYSDEEFDHFKFIGHELLLYALAVYFRAEDYGSASRLLSVPFYLTARAASAAEPIASFVAFREPMRSLVRRNKRLGLRRLSLRADMLEKRSKSSGFHFHSLMQADLICFMRAELENSPQSDRWWPETLLYAHRNYGPFEAFARATSKAQLSKLLPVLGVASLEPVKAKLAEFTADRRSLPTWEHYSFSPSVLMGFERLGTKA